MSDVHSFIATIAENRQAFDLFKLHAQKRGLFADTQSIRANEYYDKYINPKSSNRSNSCMSKTP